jgi:hypothetical protein
MKQPWMNDAGKKAETSRLTQLLGPAVLLLHPGFSLLFLVPAFAVLLPLANQPLGIVLAAVSTYFLLMAARIEKAWLSTTPLPPLTILCFGGWLRSGLGGALIALGPPNNPSPLTTGMLRYLPETQLLWLSLCGAAILIFAFWPSRLQPDDPSPQAASDQTIVNIALACSAVALGLILIGSLSGTLDRSPVAYLHWVAQRWRPDSVLVMFARFRDVFFLLAPLAINKAKFIWQKLILTIAFMIYIVLSLPLGGRGLVLWPIVYACLGLWLTPLNPKRLRAIILAATATCLILAPFIQSYKISLADYSIRRASFEQRIAAAHRALSSDNLMVGLSSDVIGSTGRALYGCVDALLFQPPASTRERAGWHGMDSVLTAWIPNLILPKSRPVRDAHLIAAEASGITRERAESMIYTSHDCVSLGGDLYWRGGWPIVALGSAFAAIAYRLLTSIWYRHAGWASTWQIFLLLYPATFLTAYPAGSIGETAWLWMWDLPKYVVLIGMTCWVIDRQSRKSTPTP